MNERIRELALAAFQPINDIASEGVADYHTFKQPWFQMYDEKFAELIVKECADICMEMAAKCAGLPGDGALAKDCAYWIKKDLGIEE